MIPLMCPIYKTFSHESCQASLMGSFQTRPGSPCWLRAKFLQSALSPASSPSCTWSSWGWWAGRRGWGCWRRSWSRWDRTWCSWGWDAARWRQSWGTPPRPPPPPSGSPRPSPRRWRCTASHFRNRTWPAQHCIKSKIFYLWQWPTWCFIKLLMQFSIHLHQETWNWNLCLSLKYSFEVNGNIKTFQWILQTNHNLWNPSNFELHELGNVVEDGEERNWNNVAFPHGHSVAELKNICDLF